MSTSNGDQFQRLLFVASCEVKIDPEFPVRGSATGHPPLASYCLGRTEFSE